MKETPPKRRSVNREKINLHCESFLAVFIFPVPSVMELNGLRLQGRRCPCKCSAEQDFYTQLVEDKIETFGKIIIMI